VFLAADSVTTVEPAKRRRDRGGRRSKRLEASLIEQERRRAIPGVGHNEAAILFMKGAC
jgi:hypothetical protein